MRISFSCPTIVVMPLPTKRPMKTVLSKRREACEYFCRYVHLVPDPFSMYTSILKVVCDPCRQTQEGSGCDRTIGPGARSCALCHKRHRSCTYRNKRIKNRSRKGQAISNETSPKHSRKPLWKSSQAHSIDVDNTATLKTEIQALKAGLEAMSTHLQQLVIAVRATNTKIDEVVRKIGE
jgi:hypothetical protein